MNKFIFIRYLIASVWFINGFFCKILNLVPRHQEIVAKILTEEYAREITFAIGILEVLLAIWIVSYFKSKLNAIVQIILVLTMNSIEFLFVLEALLWGKLNFIFAAIFIGIIYYNEFVLISKSHV